MTIESIGLRIAVPVPLRRYFDYLPPEEGEWRHLQPGMRVRVPFHHRALLGTFVGWTRESDVAWVQLKPALEVLDVEPVMTEEILKLGVWAADYYHYPIGEVLIHLLPGLLRQGKPVSLIKKWENYFLSSECKPIDFEINAAQETAIAAILAAKNNFQVFLLDGVTGSGKTEVYLQVIQSILAADKQVLVLVPEIGLTPQTIQRFKERFSVPIAALHSGLSEKQRLTAWALAKSGVAKIVIGTRSAVYSPFQQLGLIIVDEEHDLSFKQQEGFRYHARDIAIMRASFNKIPIVLGSATPALETLHKAQQNKFIHLHLSERAGLAELPTYQVLDIRNKPLEQGLSLSLIEEIKKHIARGEQVMLFLNRRGFAPVILCHACGWMADCKRCDMRMTYHQHSGRLHCHHCDTQKKLPTACEACGEKELQAVGLGTERLESVLEKYFPTFSIARIDRDNTRRKGALEKLLQGIQCGEHQILIGTQMLAKGHHFPNVTLVGIVDADGGFFSSDFRALERMGQLVLQVAGRAGRVEKAGKVIIQTHHPHHPLLHQLLQQSYQHFAATLLGERAAAHLPPYAFFGLFRAEAHSLDYAHDFLQKIKKMLPMDHQQLQLLGPFAAPMPRRAGKHRMQLLIQTTQRPLLQKFLKELMPQIEKIATKHRVRWSLDVDPLEMF